MAGTPRAGYLPPKDGPFKCSNCRHFQPSVSGCDDKEVIADLGRGKSGYADVEAEGCCNEFKSKGKRGIGQGLLKIWKAQAR